MKANTASVIWKRVVPVASGCWEWQGCRCSGYGNVSIGGRMTKVHRIAYELYYGPIPEHQPVIMHLCDNPICCNPGHLRAGTVTDNIRDMLAKGRRRHPTGDAARKSSKLTWEIVREIRARNTAGETRKALAEEFGVSVWAVHDLCSFRTWK